MGTMPAPPEPVALTVDVPGAGGGVSALSLTPAVPCATLVLAHGAGAGMSHPFMASLAGALARHGIATLRFQFPAMERGLKRPDAPATAHAAVRAAVATARQLWPDLPLLAGGKSFGARMTSQAQALAPLAGVQGLVFFGFPLHPAGRPGTERAAHLAAVQVPMLFLQGTRDALADVALLQHVLEPLAARATLRLFDDADHAFHVRARSGSTDTQVLEDLAATTATWSAHRATCHQNG